MCHTPLATRCWLLANNGNFTPWSKLGRNISIELALDPSRRALASDFLKLCRAEYDRLIEQSPCIDDDIIRVFKGRFKDLLPCLQAQHMQRVGQVYHL
jgi:hypothetical protein